MQGFWVLFLGLLIPLAAEVHSKRTSTHLHFPYPSQEVLKLLLIQRGGFYSGDMGQTEMLEEQNKCEGGCEHNEGNEEQPTMSKRKDYINWDDYFMAVAFLSAMRSKDPSTQVGACIVNDENKIVGIGYNGFPRGCSDDELPWDRSSKKGSLHTKYPYVCHAEMNAIMNKNSADLKGCRIYVALFPCNECAKLIIQSGIKEVIYVSDKYQKEPHMIASRRLLDMAKVVHRQHTPINNIQIDFSKTL